VHSRTVCIEDAYYFNFKIILPVIVKKESLSTSLAFVIAATGARNRSYRLPPLSRMRISAALNKASIFAEVSGTLAVARPNRPEYGKEQAQPP
jgi:hypothetical protein